MLEGYPTLVSITALLDDHLKSKHELFLEIELNTPS